MLELLPEEKRKILLGYWFIRDFFEKRRFLKLFKKRPTRQQFLQGLIDFKDELKSKGITDQEIEILKHGINDDEFKKIIGSLPKNERKHILLLKSKDIFKRREAILWICALWPNDPDKLVCRTKVIPEFGCTIAVILLEQMLTDPDEIVRYNALRGLDTHLKSKTSFPLIERMLYDPYYENRTFAAGILHNYSNSPFYHPLYHPDIYTRKDYSFFRPGNKGSLGQIKRRELSKDHGRIILLGGNLTGKALI